MTSVEEYIDNKGNVLCLYINNCGSKFYYKDKSFITRHREDGPAIEIDNEIKMFFINNKRYSEEEYWSIIRFGGFV